MKKRMRQLECSLGCILFESCRFEKGLWLKAYRLVKIHFCDFLSNVEEKVSKILLYNTHNVPR